MSGDGFKNVKNVHSRSFINMFFKLKENITVLEQFMVQGEDTQNPGENLTTGKFYGLDPKYLVKK